MSNNNEIIIKLSKIKIILLTLGAFGFVVLGLWIWSIADEQTRFPPVGIKIVSTASICFFGLCGVYGSYKLFDNKPGLIINNEGLFDNCSAVSVGLIKWSDITGIQVQQTRFILIFVVNPEEYLNRATKFQRFWMKMNDKIYGTPLSIPFNSLQGSFDELIKPIHIQFNKSVPDDEDPAIKTVSA